MKPALRPRVMPAEAGDDETLARLQARCFDDAWGVDGVGKTMSLPGMISLLIRVTTPGGRMPVGFVMIQVASDQADVLTVGVVPEWRGHGLARLLVGEALNSARALGARRATLEVSVENTAARALYAGFGFAPVGRRPAYYRLADGRRVDAVIMGCALEG
jgi:ribosomal-protein-alanine N-acetyltransferase